MPKTILIIAPHMDDEVLGCGGTIKKHVAAGDSVHVVIVANRAYDHVYDKALIAREKEHCACAQKILGYQTIQYLDLADEKLDQGQIELVIALEKVCVKIDPDIVYMPHNGDNHQDHRAVHDAVRIALRPHVQKRAATLRVYEVPSSTDSAPQSLRSHFVPTLYVDIAKTLDAKIKALACYETEVRAFPHPRSPEALAVFAKKRGTEIGLCAAEAFMEIRCVWV